MNNMKKNPQIKGMKINKEIITNKKEENIKIDITNDKKDSFEIEKDDPELTRINDEYQLIESEQLGGGAFGVVYKCISLIEPKKEFAAKIESNDSIKPQLNHEYKILKYLEGGEGIPKTFLLKNTSFSTIMIFELLGPNLEDILLDTKEKKIFL